MHGAQSSATATAGSTPIPGRQESGVAEPTAKDPDHYRQAMAGQPSRTAPGARCSVSSRRTRPRAGCRTGPVRRLGPIQSQVPRAPFLTASSRLPGVTYDTVNDLFDRHQLVKTSNLRGTVHTSTREHSPGSTPWPGRCGRPRPGSILDLGTASPEQLLRRDRTVLCRRLAAARRDRRAHPRLAGRTRRLGAARRSGAQAVVWGHSGLLRRPRDTHWERRTDIFHRTAGAVLPDLAELRLPRGPPRSRARLHLGSYGPVTRADLAFFFGVRPGRSTQAVAASSEADRTVTGEDGETYLELADPPTDDTPDPGLRLLPEFDGLLLGFAGRNRHSILHSRGTAAEIWAKVNGLFAPVVLHDRRLVASWRTLTRGRRTDVEVTMLGARRPLAEDRLSDAVRAVEPVLDLTITDIRLAG